MRTRTKILLCVFGLLALADVLLLAFGNETAPHFVNPFLMPFLCASALSELLPEHAGRTALLLAVGLAFHTAGDVFLMFDSLGFIWFALGLLSFLIGHFFYLAILLPPLGKLSPKEAMVACMVPMLVVGAIVPWFRLQWPLNAAITVYGLTLLYVAAAGVVGAIRKLPLSGWIIAGGLVFLLYFSGGGGDV